jgi:hypothetical protein
VRAALPASLRVACAVCEHAWCLSPTESDVCVTGRIALGLTDEETVNIAVRRVLWNIFKAGVCKC